MRHSTGRKSPLVRFALLWKLSVPLGKSVILVRSTMVRLWPQSWSAGWVRRGERTAHCRFSLLSLRRKRLQVAAVLLVSPSYEGVCADVVSAARVCRSAGVPLIVDEAHGAHLDFLETHGGREAFPRGATTMGGDAAAVRRSLRRSIGTLPRPMFLASRG